MSDDRSERLRKRRKQTTESLDLQDRSRDGTPPNPSTQDESPDESDLSGDETDREASAGGKQTVSIKEEQIGTYMYLPESQTKELRRLYNVLKAEYEFEYDEELEKNRHFYPLVVQYGLDGLDGLDASEIRTYLEEMT